MRGLERAAGDDVGGYRVIRPLGRGGSGAVYLVEDHGGGQAALKLVDMADAGARVRLGREVAALQALRHRSVPRVLDAELDDAEPFVVFELVDGPSLSTYVARSGPLAPDAVAGLADALASALEAVHAAGVVHRDVTPSNVLMSPDGPVLIDFGLSHGVEDDRLTRTGLVSGTSGYVAPEVIDGADPTPASDDWALAATLAFAATGHAPFGTGAGALRASLDGAVRADVPVALARALTCALQFRPGAQELARMLRSETELMPTTPPTLVAPMGGAFVDEPDDPPSDDAEYDDDDDDAEFDEAGYDDEADEETGPALPQRRTVLFAWAGALVALATIAPYAAGLAAVLLVVTARATEYAARAVWRSRRRRGADYGGVGPQLLAIPWHAARALVTGSPSMVLGALVAGGVGILGWWITGFLDDPLLWRVLVLALAAVGAISLVAWGPGSRDTRAGAHRVAAAFAPRRAWSAGWVTIAVVVVVTCLGVALAGVPPVSWPLEAGTLVP